MSLEREPRLVHPAAVGTESQRFESSPYQQNYEALDYDIIENELYKAEQRAMTPWQRRLRPLLQFLITLGIGLIVAGIGFFVVYVLRVLGNAKAQWANDFVSDCKHYRCLWLPFLCYTAASMVLASLAAALVAVMEPIAAGSGVPEIKAYLNGIKVPRILRFKTFFVKIVGVMFAVAGGLAGGKEEPLIHIGSIVAAGISQGKINFIPLDSKGLKQFRTDHEKRDFIAGGAAAGVAAAFGAPIGGVLFTIEYGASFWSGSLTWRTFFAAVVAAFGINFLLSGAQGNWGSFADQGLIQFGTFKGIEYGIEQFPLFAVIGLGGGLLGALFNFLNVRFYRLRMLLIHRRSVRVLEVTLLGLLTALCTLFLPLWLGRCHTENTSDMQDVTYERILRQWTCANGYYNDLGTLFFNTQEDAVRAIFHNSTEFSNASLCIFFIVYFLLHCLTYGAFVPCGIFVPCLLLGCTYGSLFGAVSNQFWPSQTNLPLFALLGAAALLSGVTRMTIALAAIILEASNNISFGVPVLLVIVVSKWVANLFNEGIYESYIAMRRIPLLPPEHPTGMKRLRARDVMSHPVIAFKRIERVGFVHQVLLSCAHNGFPVVDGAGSCIGLVLRSQLITLLKKKNFLPAERDQRRLGDIMIRTLLRKKTFVDPAKGPGARELTLWDFQEDYPRYPDLSAVRLSQQEQQQRLDLAPYMNPAPFKVQQNTPLPRVFRLFRTLGLRHLIAVTAENRPSGMITRHDLAFFEQRAQENGNVIMVGQTDDQGKPM